VQLAGISDLIDSSMNGRSDDGASDEWLGWLDLAVDKTGSQIYGLRTVSPVLMP
jgi:hypothetical protein